MKFSKITFLIGVTVVVLVAFFCGFLLSSATNQKGSAFSLSESTVEAAAAKSGVQTFLPQQLNGRNSAAITLHGIQGVSVAVGSKHVDLISALSDGRLSVEYLVAQAFLDARNGVCERVALSQNGVNLFRFLYPNFDLCVTWDVYESALGEDAAVFSVDFYLPGQSVSATVDRFLYREDGTSIDTQQKDWGLTFTLTEATAKGVTFRATQNGGQEAGALSIERYHIYRLTSDGSEEVGFTCTMEEEAQLRKSYSLPQNGESTVSIEWEDIYGSLSEGNYELHLIVEDAAQSAASQRYVLPFSIS